jgi:hypothetical protein
MRIAEAIAEQIAANRSGLGHEASFEHHRARLTSELVARAPRGGGGRLALLGAGNANDVDLAALAGAYGEIHLVDIDPESLARARARLDPAVAARVFAHAPVDVSGVFDRLPTWAAAHPPPAASALATEVPGAIERVVARIPGPFDVVASCCLLTQIQLVLLQVVGDRHPRFPELRAVVNAVHVRVLASLLAPGGVALLMTDMTSSETYPLDHLPPDADLRRVMDDLLGAGNLIAAAHPGLLSSEVRRDPNLNERFAFRPQVGPWLWKNGPSLTFLVYGLELVRLR